MSNTRHSQTGRLADERYMSSEAMVEQRGLSGIAVASRVFLLDNPAQRSLAWFIQAMSMREGGLGRFAVDFLAAHPNGFPHPFAGKARDGGVYPQQIDVWEGSISHILRELCLNPNLNFPRPGEHAYPDTIPHGQLGTDFLFQDAHQIAAIVPALYKYQRRHAERVRAEFALTEVGKIVWGTLDACLALRRMVVLDGREGIGKTEAVKAWADAHLGEARFVSLSGVSNKSSVFRAISETLGLGASRERKAVDMQSRIENVLARSGLMLLLDESHFLFNQTPRVTTVPELIDWVDTALRNHGVPAALICTPQFSRHLGRAEQQVGWNAGQFKRRLLRYQVLPDSISVNDLMKVARCVVPGLSEAGLKILVGYSADNKQSLSAMTHAVDEARWIAMQDGRDAITAQDVRRAVLDYRIPSDKAIASAMASPAPAGRKSRKPAPVPVADGLQEDFSRDAEPLLERESAPDTKANPETSPRRETAPATAKFRTGRIDLVNT